MDLWLGVDRTNASLAVIFAAMMIAEMVHFNHVLKARANKLYSARQIEVGELDIRYTESELRPVIEVAVVSLQLLADSNDFKLCLMIDPRLQD